MVADIRAAHGSQESLRAAQYVRMSTDLQQYSIQNQMESIAAYALRRNIAIVRNYADEGRSGLRLDDRPALTGLLNDVQSGAAQDWDAACSNMHLHALARIKEVGNYARVHRDPFEAILVVLEADSPLAEYRKIADEIVRLMPDEDRYPLGIRKCAIAAYDPAWFAHRLATKEFA
jgi:hypothetical protein